MQKTIPHKTVLITGATSGIGLATAQLFAKKQYNILLAGRNATSLEQAANSVDGNVQTYQADIADISQLDALYAKIQSDGHKLNALVVNAAIAKPLPFGDVNEENFDLTMNTNFKGAFFTLQKALPLMDKNATAVFTTSITNQLGSPNFSVYAAAKAALKSLVKTLGLELIGQGIRVNAVSPGPINTPMFDKFGLPEEATQEIQAAIKTKSPSQRFGEPEEVAKAIHFLCSEDSSYIVGEELVIDGGMSLL